MEKMSRLENKANDLLVKCEHMALTSVNDEGYPRTCMISKAKADDFMSIYFATGKSDAKQSKVTHFEKCSKASVCFTKEFDSVTLVGDVEIVDDMELKKELWKESFHTFFKEGVEDPAYTILRFKTNEATFWINDEFQTNTY